MSAAILNACSLDNMWKYVCNSMECHLQCCRDFISCDLKTNEIDIEPDNRNNCAFVQLLNDFCMPVDSESVDEDQ